MNRRGGLLFPSVNGEDSKVRILSKAGMKKWESDFMDMYGKKPKYRVTDTEPVTVEITNNFFREKKDRFSRGKHEFLNDPGFRDSSKD